MVVYPFDCHYLRHKLGTLPIHRSPGKDWETYRLANRKLLLLLDNVIRLLLF